MTCDVQIAELRDLRLFVVALAQSNGARMGALTAAIKRCVAKYFELLSQPPASLDAAAIQEVWLDTLAFMGCELLRRVLGVAKRAELEEVRSRPSTATAIPMAIGRCP